MRVGRRIRWAAVVVGVAAIASLVTLGALAGSADAWLTTRTTATHALPNRFPDIAAVGCVPDRTSPTRVFGTTRYWQQFWCSGRTHDQLSFRLRFKTTGQCAACWTITNLTGVTVSHLRVRHTSTATTPTTSGSPTSCPSGYYRNSYGHCVLRPTANPPDPAGATALCVDGTYSFSEHASGTCSHHGGVARWINHP
jgi:hypothetical protein